VIKNLDPGDLVKEQCTDGAEWAMYFMDMHGDKLNGLYEHDMRAWFTNAMSCVKESITNEHNDRMKSRLKWIMDNL
jgi:hypothetical protein